MNQQTPTDTSLVRIKLWAPLAHRAEVVVDGQRTAMHPLGEEYWTTELAVGTDYLLAIDGGEPHPDPRSARQPFGVHGPSRVFDPAAHQWTDGAWPGSRVLGSVIYEMHVGTFTPAGTLDAAIERLPHLVELGVGTVELMPVVPFPGDRGWGYDGVSLYAVHEAYGGPAALQRFVDAAHRSGLAVCLDVVYNHFGPAGNYAPAFGPYFTDKHHTPWGAAVNLDDEYCRGVRDFICDNAIRWLTEFHVDALRLDAVHALEDDSPVHILAELSARVDAIRPGLGREVALIAESDLNQVGMVLPRSEGGLGIDAQWADDVHHALHAYLTDETFGYYVDFGPAQVLAHALEQVFVHAGGWSTFRKRNWGAPVPADVPRDKFVVFTQNHDQVGNRGLGDRPDARLDDGTVAGGAALMLLGPFTPLLFQGQEWGTQRPFQFFTSHDEDLGVAVTRGRLAEFSGHDWHVIYGPDPDVPDPQAESTFLASKLDWQELEAPGHAELLAWYRELIALRSQLPPARQLCPVETQPGDGWFKMSYGPFTTVICPGQHPAQVPVDGARIAARWGLAEVRDGVALLPAHSVVVIRAS